MTTELFVTILLLAWLAWWCWSDKEAHSDQG